MSNWTLTITLNGTSIEQLAQVTTLCQSIGVTVQTKPTDRAAVDATIFAAVEQLDQKRKAGRPANGTVPVGGKSAADLAYQLGVSRDKVEKARSILTNGTDAVKEALRGGTVTINKVSVGIKKCKNRDSIDGSKMRFLNKCSTIAEALTILREEHILQVGSASVSDKLTKFILEFIDNSPNGTARAVDIGRAGLSDPKMVKTTYPGAPDPRCEGWANPAVLHLINMGMLERITLPNPNYSRGRGRGRKTIVANKITIIGKRWLSEINLFNPPSKRE